MNIQNQAGTIMNTNTFYLIDHMATELMETNEKGRLHWEDSHPQQECDNWDYYMAEMPCILIY